MLPRVRQIRSSYQKKTSLFASKTRQNGRTKNVLKKDNFDAKYKKKVSYFLRIFVSGVLVLLLVFIFLIYKQFTLAVVDTSESYTRLFVYSAESGSPSILMSLRGQDKGISLTFFQQESMMLFGQKSPQPINSVLTNSSSVAFHLGVPVDEIVKAEAHHFTSLNKQQLLKLNDPFAQGSSLSFVDKLKIWWYIFRLDPALVTQKNLQNLNIKSPLTVTEDAYLNFIKAFYTDTAIRSQAPTIAIVNATQETGLGKWLASMLSSWGYQVVNIDSQQSVNDSSVLIVSSRVPRHSIRRISTLYTQPIEIKNDDHILDQYRSQIVLYVGKDLLSE